MLNQVLILNAAASVGPNNYSKVLLLWLRMQVFYIDLEHWINKLSLFSGI